VARQVALGDALRPAGLTTVRVPRGAHGSAGHRPVPRPDRQATRRDGFGLRQEDSQAWLPAGAGVTAAATRSAACVRLLPRYVPGTPRRDCGDTNAFPA
jgi:hypothetical protein